MKEAGCEWIEDKKTYEWYGRHAGDYPIPAGMTKAQLGGCDHVIRVPGVRYEIGVVKLENGGYTLAYDFYGSGGHHDGQKLLAKFGEGLKSLVQSYAVNVASMAARAKGWMISKQTLGNGSVKLTLTGAM